MTLRPWHLLLVLAALIVPLQAGALGGSGSTSLQVSASLDYCGAGSTGVSCKIDASWSGVDGAELYTATATLADGSVIDLGSVGAGGGSTSIWVPYVGNGVYTVTITAWGSDSEGKQKKIDDAEAKVDPPAKPDQKEEDSTNGDADKQPAAPPEDDGSKPPTTPGDPPPAEPAPPVTPTPDPAPAPDPEPEPAQPAPEPAAGTGTEGGPATPAPQAGPDAGAAETGQP